MKHFFMQNQLVFFVSDCFLRNMKLFFRNKILFMQHQIFVSISRGGSRAAATSKMECCVIIVNGFRLSRGHISGHRCSILCINDMLFKNCLKHVHLKDFFIALFDLGSEHGSTRSITIWCSILCMNNRYLEKSSKKIAPSQKITPWKYDPRKIVPPRTIAP